MPGREYRALNSYRYGFNGKENDNEVKGEGEQQDYGMRIYDPRLGRFLSVDPIADDYPELSPYQFGGNTPVQATDLDGLEPAYHYTDSKFGVVMMPAGDNLQRAVPPEHQKFLPQAAPASKEGMQALSTTLDFIPLVGTVKGAIEGAAGYDMAGNKLSGTDRALGLIPYLKAAKNAKTVLKVEKQLNNAAKAEKAIVKTEKAVESTEKVLVKRNKVAGDLREIKEEGILKGKYPNGDVQNQRYLRDANGKIVKDPLTGKARRLDHVVIEDGKAIDAVETTSTTANKTSQVAKENRIREAGGTYVRDKKTGKLVDVKEVPTRISRHN